MGYKSTVFQVFWLFILSLRNTSFDIKIFVLLVWLQHMFWDFRILTFAFVLLLFLMFCWFWRNIKLVYSIIFVLNYVLDFLSIKVLNKVFLSFHHKSNYLTLRHIKLFKEEYSSRYIIISLINIFHVLV